MGRYFKVIDKNRTDGRIKVLDAPEGSQVLYDIIDYMVGEKLHPSGVPFSIEVDSWAELACIGEIYETKDFVVECLSEEEYLEYQN